MEPAWDFDTLRTWFQAREDQEALETDLLREFFPDSDPFSGGVGLELFHKHFLLYRRLWIFDDELRTATGHRLWIRGIRSTLLAPPAKGHCSWLNLDTGQYCQVETEDEGCSLHSASVPQPNTMKSYYLDWNNLTGMTEETLKTMMDKFYRRMDRQAAADEALAVLGLPQDADARTIRARWRQLSLDHHPDRGGDPTQFRRFSAAWSALKPKE